MNQQVCRCCLAVNNNININIFDGDNRRLVLVCVPSLSIEQGDGLPTTICDTCWGCVCETAKFRTRCQLSEQRLRSRSANTEQKVIEVEFNSQFAHSSEEVKELLIAKPFPLSTNLIDIIDDGSSIVDLENLPAFDNLDMPLFNDLLLADYTCNNGADDPALNELFSNVLNDPAFDNFDLIKSAPIEPIQQSGQLGNLFSNSTDFPHIGGLNSAQVATQQPPFELAILAPSTALQAPYAPALPLFPAMPTTQASSGIAIATELQPCSPQSTKKSVKLLHACTECEKKFTRNFQLKLHMKSVHNLGDGLRYKCGECAKTFASRHSLNYHHKSTHSNERPFACAVCDRRFVLRTQLESHQRIHTGEAKPRIFECMDCKKLWPTRSDLRTHMRSHNPNVERRFNCDRCAKKFFTRGHLSSHMLVHTGEKPFLCSFCEKAYQSVGNLNNHMLRRHDQMHDHQFGEASFEI